MTNIKLLKAPKIAFEVLKNNVDDYRNRDANEKEFKKLPKITSTYKIQCAGDVCVGDEIVYASRVWDRIPINSYGKLVNAVVNYELIQCTVKRDSYGAGKQQHTFTLELPNKKKKLIKGRNLYGVGVWRKEWKNESERGNALDEKHTRGNEARKAREARRDEGTSFGAW